MDREIRTGPIRRDHSSTRPATPMSEGERLTRILKGLPLEEVKPRFLNRLDEREVLEFLATFSSEHARKLSELRAEEAEQARSYETSHRERTAGDCWTSEWNETDHPRTGSAPNPGWFASKGGGAAGGASGVERGIADPDNPAHWHLPADEKGTWSGKKGQSTFRLKQPVNVNGKRVHEIKFVNNLPVMENLALQGKSPVIVLTGDAKIDDRNAREAWKRLNPGKELPRNATFHHDLLHAAEETAELNGKKTKVLVGKMHLVPRDVHRTLYHEGSASVATKFYKGLGIDLESVAEFARKEAETAHKADAFVAKAAKKIIPNTIPKGLRGFIGRSVLRAIPLVGTGLAILEFADNAQAHGVAGAAVRATPVLGDLIGAHDLGSELARQIEDDANAAGDENIKKINKPVSDAWEKASRQTAEAFQDLAPHIRVTNTYGANGLVDPHEVSAALRKYRDSMYTANYLNSQNVPGHNYAAKAAQAKRELKAELERAAQKQQPVTRSYGT